MQIVAVDDLGQYSQVRRAPVNMYRNSTMDSLTYKDGSLGNDSLSVETDCAVTVSLLQSL